MSIYQNRIVRHLFVLFTLLGSHQLLAGGGWTHPKGKGFFKISQWWVIANKHYTSTGTVTGNPTMGNFNTSLYGEYGLTDRLNAQLYFPFFSRAFNNTQVFSNQAPPEPGRAVNTIGDTDIGLKYALVMNKPIVLAGYFWLGLPTGKGSDGDNIPVLLTGDGEFNQMVGLVGSTSQSFGSWVNAYTSVDVAYNNRTNGFSDEFRLNFELGAVIKNKLILAYKLRWLKPLKETGSTQVTGSSIFSNNVEYVGYAYEAAYNITQKLGLSFAYGAVYSAKLIFANPSYEVGVYFNLR